jgi:hypothetical protein
VKTEQDSRVEEPLSCEALGIPLELETRSRRLLTHEVMPASK